MVRSGESRWFSHLYYIYIICHFPVCLTLCFELLPLAETLSVLHIFDHPGQPVPTKKPISSFTQRSAWDELIFTAWWWLEPWNLMTCHSVGNFIIPTDFHIFQRGRYTTNQLFLSLKIIWSKSQVSLATPPGFRKAQYASEREEMERLRQSAVEAKKYQTMLGIYPTDLRKA